MIYVYGDSHTAGINKDKPLGLEYTHTAWPTYLSELINMPIKNMAYPGKNIILNVNDLISQMFEIKDNAKIVIFQFQFFFNALLRLDKRDIGWKDLFQQNDILFGPIWTHTPQTGFIVKDLNKKEEIEKLGIVDMNDYNALLTWFSKYEQRRMWYEMNKVKLIFDELEKFGIKCYCFYWAEIEDFLLMDSPERIIKFDGKTFVQELNLTTLDVETKGVWKDGHLGNNGNKVLAEKIYDYILNSK